MLSQSTRIIVLVLEIYTIIYIPMAKIKQNHYAYSTQYV